MAIQMIVIILAGTFGGKYLDARFQYGFPVFTITGVILSVFLARYISIREVLKK